MSSHQLTGQCLCKAVTLSANNIKPQIDACHCTMCRTWSGGPHLGLVCDDGLQIEGEANINVYQSSP